MINDNEYLLMLDEVNKVIGDFSKLRNKKILIIGSTGTIGSFLVDTLMRRNKLYGDNITIYAGSRSKGSIEKRFGSYIGDSNFIECAFDITKECELDILVDYIIHAGSDSYPKAFAETPVEVMESNVVGTNNLLKYCKNHNTRMLYISSGEVYGMYDLDAPIKEDYQGYVDILRSRSCYPVSKRASETLCMAYNEEYNTDIVIARLSHVYSPLYKDSDNKVHIMFIENCLKGNDLVFKRGVSQVRSYTFIVDAITGILKILMDGVCGEVYNVSNENSVISLEEMASLITEITNTKIIYEDSGVDEKVSNKMNYAVLDNSKLKNLGWYGLYNFYDGIKRVISIRGRF